MVRSANGAGAERGSGRNSEVLDSGERERERERYHAPERIEARNWRVDKFEELL